MYRILIIFITCLLTALASADAARPRKKVRQQAKPTTTQTVKQKKKENERAIKETSKKIEVNTKETARQLNNLNLLAAEIKETDNTIATIGHSVDSLNKAIKAINDSIATLDASVKAMQQKYANALRHFQGRRVSMSPLAFVFSSESFQQAYRRLRYLQQFSRWRERKTRDIKAAQETLTTQRTRLSSLQSTRRESLNSLNTARASLNSKRRDTDALVASLKQEGGALKSLLRQKEKEARDLDNELNRLIAEEQRRREEQLAEQRRREEAARQARLAEERRQQELAAEAERRRQQEEAIAQAERKKAEKAIAEAKTDKSKPVPKKEKPKKEKPQKPKAQKHDKKPQKEKAAPQTTAAGDVAMNTPSTKSVTAADLDRLAKEDIKISGDFESNRGRLPYPVAGRYRIVKHFGRQRHPELKYVETDNSGIDIEVGSGAAARAIFPGKVSAIFHQPGFNTIVMVRHGNYLTIYAGLGSIAVKTGDSVKPNQTIGSVFADPDDGGRSILHFEIRKEKNKLNPEEWLR